MTHNITIGKYLYQDSVIHNLDPRTKLLGALLYVISLFLISNPYWYILSLGVILVLYRLANVSIMYFLSGLKGIIILLVLTMVFRAIATPGTSIIDLGILTPTFQGVNEGIKLVSRISLMIIATSLLAYTSTPREMALGLEQAFSFLKRIKIPIGDMSLIVMIALRFIPVMIEEFGNIIDAQSSRGAKISDGTIMQKCRGVFTILVPVFISIIQKSSDLAMAMESRGYGQSTKTSKMYPLHYTRNDYFSYVLIIAYIITFVAIKFV